MEKSNEVIKRKHKEFNDRVSAAVSGKGSNTVDSQLSPAIQKLRQLAQLRRPTLERPFGS